MVISINSDSRINSLQSDQHSNMKIYDVYRPLSSKPMRQREIFLLTIKRFFNLYTLQFYSLWFLEQRPWADDASQQEMGAAEGSD